MPSDVSQTPFGAALLAGKRALSALKGVTVTYSTGTMEIPVRARIGQTKFIIDSDRQFNTRVRTRDYLIEKTELIDPDSGDLFEPCEGHRIIESSGDQTTVYEVLPIGDEPAFRDSDTTAREWRIHTKRVTPEPVTPDQEEDDNEGGGEQ